MTRSSSTHGTSEKDADRAKRTVSVGEPPGFLIRRLHQIATAIFAEEMSAYDVTPVQFATLSVLSKAPGLDQASAATRVGIDKTTIVGVIERLQRKGLVTREVSKTDKRARILNLTAAGCALVQKMQRSSEAIDARMLEPMAPGEQAFLKEQLTKLIRFHESRGVVPGPRDVD